VAAASGLPCCYFVLAEYLSLRPTQPPDTACLTCTVPEATFALVNVPVTVAL